MDVNDTRNWYTDSLGVQKLRNVPLRASSMITLIEDEQTKAYLVNSTTESMNTGGSSFQCGGPACE